MVRAIKEPSLSRLAARAAVLDLHTVQGFAIALIGTKRALWTQNPSKAGEHARTGSAAGLIDLRSPV